MVEEFLINAELVAIDIQRVLLADESKSGTELGQGLGHPQDHALSIALSRASSVKRLGTMAAAILMLGSSAQARTPPRLCPRLPEACRLHGPSQLEAGGVRP